MPARPLDSLGSTVEVRRPEASSMSKHILLVAALACAPLAASSAQQTTRPLTTADIQAWKNIRAQALSNDGNWFAYQLAPNDGDAEVVLRSVRESKEHRFQIGEPPAPAGGPPGAAAAGAPLVIAPTSKFVAFSVYPSAKEAKRLKSQRRPLYNKLALVNMATGE